MLINRNVPPGSSVHHHPCKKPMSIFKFKWHFSQKAQQKTGWLTSKETSCQFVQSTCIKLKESAQHTGWLTGEGGCWRLVWGTKKKKKQKALKIKNEQNFCYCIWKWQAWQGRARGAWLGAVELPSPCMRLHSQCSACPFASFLLVCPCNLYPSSCPLFHLFFFFLCFSVFRFCSGNGNWMVKFRKMQFERTPETRDETVKAERQQNATARAAAASTGQQQQQVEQQ